MKIRAYYHRALLLLGILASSAFVYPGLQARQTTADRPSLFAEDNSNLASHSEPAQSAIAESDGRNVWLNVFVHGIISIKPHITVSNFVRFLTDNVCESIYAETVDLMRDDPFFFQNQAVQARGLHKIDINLQQKGAAATAMANVFEMVNQINPLVTSKNVYYTYGWSGLLSRSARYNDARDFLFELDKEVAAYRAQGINPKVRLFGYSHGGTIVIKLAMVKQRENLQPNFSVDEAFLFGTPIQFDTDYYINDPIFKKIYNVFSKGDRVQKLDFFSSGEFFSDRAFKSHCDFTVPDKLVQIEIRVIRKKGEACLPLSLDTQDCTVLYNGKRCSRNFRNVSPGHTELWFFGWTPLNYRCTFPLYPLPIVSMMPFIINSIKPFEPNFNPEIPITVTIDARRNSMVVNNNLKCPQVYKLPFMGIGNLLALREKALVYKPDPALFNKETFDEHILQAYDQAVIILKDKKCQKKIEAQEAVACK